MKQKFHSNTEMQGIIQEYYKGLYATKFNNLEEMVKFLETQSLTRLNHEELENPNQQINSNKLSQSSQTSPKAEVQDQLASLANSTKHRGSDTCPPQILPKIEEGAILPKLIL